MALKTTNKESEDDMTKTPKLSREDLTQFTGSENWYRHGLNPKVLFTDGAKYVADEGGAYWLLDIIASAQLYKKRVAAEESSRRRSRFRSEADQDSGGKPITHSGAKPISDSRLKAISNRPPAEL